MSAAKISPLVQTRLASRASGTCGPQNSRNRSAVTNGFGSKKLLTTPT